jgi:tyramine---L-glutamate ligase
MQPLKKLFVCEFITGGGFIGQDLPDGLAREGILMRDALLNDLSELIECEVYTTYDMRVEPPHGQFVSYRVSETVDIWALWQQCILQADYVWLIAPETNGILFRLTNMVIDSQKKLIGCGLDAIKITSSKYLTAQHLLGCNIKVVPSYDLGDYDALGKGKWVVKPDDGAGCEDTFVFEDALQLSHWCQTHPQHQRTHIIQPYIDGVPASISVLGYGNQVQVLSCNQQQIKLSHGQLHYVGGVLNGMIELKNEMLKIAQKVQQAIPTLQGYYGVDVIVGFQESTITVIEINPRLTTSYIRLRDAMACNPSQIIIEALSQSDFAMPDIEFNRVMFNVNH